MDFLLNFLFSPLPTSAIVSLFALMGAALVYLNTRPKPLTMPADLNCQTVGVKDGARKSALQEDDNLMSYFHDDARTLYEVFQRGLQVSGNGPCLGYRKPGQPYQWLKYKQVSNRAEHLGSGLIHRGLKPTPDTFIGIFVEYISSITVILMHTEVAVIELFEKSEIGARCFPPTQWIISELACYTYSMVAVPLYDTLGHEALEFIIKKADISTVLCDKQNKAETLLENCEKGETPELKTIILMDAFDTELTARGAKCGVDILSLKEVEALGKDHLHKPVPPKPEDLSIICFTSGTTGDPKGAMLTHENVVSDAAGVIKTFEVSEDIEFTESACVLSQTVLYGAGARVGFFQGDIKLLPDDMKYLQPTVFPVVPRLLNRVYDKVQSGAQTPFKKWLLNFAIDRKLAEVKEGVIRKDSIWDKLIFHKVQESLGGRVRVMVTGAAPISPSVLNFLRASLGCQIFEAYGQTECTAACSFTMPGDATSGHVGAPIPCNIVKLVDVEEMNYFASNGEGEVCIKGKNVFIGYLKDPEKTAEALDKDGWLHTGDIGKWLPSGVLKIVDRKKNIFKLAQGEYIAPERIENVYIRSAPVAQVFVHGDSLQASLVAIVVPDPEVLPGFAQKLGVQGSHEELCKSQKIKKAIIADLVKLGRQAGLKSFEQVKDLYMHPELFTIENGLLTPTLKAKRADLKKLFQPQIDSLYASME
uniref:Long-chain-fatty-acid--CoA ligase n=1 Tax=Oncorhynchus mykiss TaxID=8022 RepID=A0A8C7TE53_ONCMY